MKTILKNGEFLREPDEIAEFRVKHQGWSYTSKSQWKESIRDKKPIILEALPEKMVEEMKKADEAVKNKKFKKPNKK